MSKLLFIKLAKFLKTNKRYTYCTNETSSYIAVTMLHLSNIKRNCSMNLVDLHTFVIVAEMGTITAAAEKMMLPKSTISRRIKRLEEEINISLIHRASRKTRLTSDGLVLYQKVASAMQELQDVGLLLKERGSEPVGTLRITTTHSYARAPSVVSCIQQFQEKYPRVRIELILSEQIRKLEDENIDIALRLHTNNIPGGMNLMARGLHKFHLGIYATPHYLNIHGTPTAPQQLCTHSFISQTHAPFENQEWKNKNNDAHKQLNFPKAQISINDHQTLIEFGLASAGLFIADEQSVERFVANGDLIRVLPEYEQEMAKASIVWINNKHLSPKVRAFIDHAVACLGEA
jgi:DNA-binding transcriptional LysR family regulator